MKELIKLKNKIKNGKEVNVEDFLSLSKLYFTSEKSEVLDYLKTLDYEDPDKQWIEVLIDFFSTNLKHVENQIKNNNKASYYLGILEELNTTVVFDSYLEVLQFSFKQKDETLTTNILRGINLHLIKKPEIDIHKLDIVATIIHNIIKGIDDSNFNETKLASTIYCLRGVGNHDSLTILKSLKLELKYPYDTTIKETIRAIKKRLKL